MSHTITFCPHTFTCKCSLQWVIALVREASSFCYTINTGPSLGLLLDTLLLPGVMEMLKLLLSRISPSRCSSSSEVGLMLGGPAQNPGSGPPQGPSLPHCPGKQREVRALLSKAASEGQGQLLQSSDMNMVSGFSLDYGSLHGLWKEHRHWTSAQTSASGTQTWLSWVQTSPWPWVAAQASSSHLQFRLSS